MSDLFSNDNPRSPRATTAPLAERVRPKVLGEFVGGLGRRAFLLLFRSWRLWRLAEQVASVSQLLDEAAFLEFLEHLHEGATQGFLKAQGAREFVDRNRVVSKLQKTQDIINAEMSGASHGRGPFLGAKGHRNDFIHFRELLCNLFLLWGIS